MLRAAVLVIASTFATAAFPQAADERWVYVVTDRNGAVWYLNRRLSYLRGNNPTAWFRIDHSSNRTVKWRTSMNRTEFDCLNHRIRIISIRNYLPDGRSEEGLPILGFRDVVPDTISESISEAVCTLSANAPGASR